MRSKAYRAIGVNRVDLRRCLQARQGQALVVGLDVGKQEILVMLRWADGDFEKPWKVRNPEQIATFVELLQVLQQECSLRVAMEPTGTYGDPLRQALARAGIEGRRVSPKMASDFAEVFDGVPSQHDGKDAAVVAELAAQGRSWVWPWPSRSAEQAERELLVDWLDAQRRQMMLWYGRLEASLSRHWPEATRIVKLNSGVLLRALVEYGGPRALAADATALSRLHRWGLGRLSQLKAEALVSSARATVGVQTNGWDEERLRRYAGEISKCRQELRRSGGRLVELAKKHAVIQAQAEVVGVNTASVLWVHLGDPGAYSCAAAYGKAMGLNLAERSSGQYQGELRISKRGPASVRRWLYMAALRWLRREPVKSWFAAQKAARRGQAKAAVVGVMRKLAGALYHVGRGAKFEPARLHPALAAPSKKPELAPEVTVPARDVVLGAGAP